MDYRLMEMLTKLPPHTRLASSGAWPGQLCRCTSAFLPVGASIPSPFVRGLNLAFWLTLISLPVELCYLPRPCPWVHKVAGPFRTPAALHPSNPTQELTRQLAHLSACCLQHWVRNDYCQNDSPPKSHMFGKLSRRGCVA